MTSPPPPIVIGVDPGPTTGIAVLRPRPADRPSAVQCDHTVALLVVDALLAMAEHAAMPVLLAVERFVVGSRASRSSSAEAGEITRHLIGGLLGRAGRQTKPAGSVHVLNFHIVEAALRSAAEVKPWATDERLGAADLLDLTKGMTHARDAARHALFAAVRAGYRLDPLSGRRSAR